jgi:hypothetical protein
MTPHAAAPPNLPFVFKYFWVLFIAVGLLNTQYAWRAVKSRLELHPDLEPGYRFYFLAYAFWSNLPWLLIGAGIVWGGVAGPGDFLKPWQGNPMVLAWWGAMALFSVLLTGWIFAGGAEKLERYPGLPMVPLTGAKKIKLYALLMLGWYLVIAAALIIGVPLLRGRLKGIQLDEVIPILFPFFFTAMWILVSWTLAQMGGWALLATRYRTDQRFEGGPLLGLSGAFGMARYNGVLRGAANSQGFYLAVMFLFRVAHPPLFIPWADLKASPQKGFLEDYVVLEFAQAPGVMLKLRKKDVLKLREKSDYPRAFEGVSLE